MIHDLISRVSAEFGVSVLDIRSARRGEGAAEARQVVMYLARQHTTMSLPQIGREVGRDHTTVMHAVSRVRERIRLEPGFAAAVARCQPIEAMEAA